MSIWIESSTPGECFRHASVMAVLGAPNILWLVEAGARHNHVAVATAAAGLVLFPAAGIYFLRKGLRMQAQRREAACP